MIIVKELSIVFALYLLGEGISQLLPFTFPGSIIGMVLLFLALLFQWLRLEQIKHVSTFFLKYMSLFFIPAGVSLMASFSLIEEHISSILLTLLFSTVFMLAFIALVVDFLIKKFKDV